MKRREEMSLIERLYVFEVIKGLFITGRHLVKNFFSIVAYSLGLKEQSGLATIQYPDERRPYPARYRGRHRLTLKQDGSPKCTACYLCSTACPADCIFIEAAEHEDPKVEKFPSRYEIDTLLCVYCGYCVEACPVDAIRMDTGIHPEVYPADPRAFVEDREALMERSRIIDRDGPDALIKAHIEKIKKEESRSLTLSSGSD